MYGNIVANLEDLSAQEKERYHSLYCGLCHTLKSRYGNVTRMSLSYDLTFFIMLLNSLYEPSETITSNGCVLRQSSETTTVSEFTEYAADLSILLAYHKCLDDWNDERKVLAKTFSLALKRSYQEAAERRREQAHSIEEALGTISMLEAQRSDSLDASAQAFGAMLGNLMLYHHDHWSEVLYRLGYELGQFIYILDAALDLEDDRKTGSYNPFICAETDPSHIPMLLSTLMGNAADALERLPLVEDLHILRSVVYAGVWQRYNVAHPDALLPSQATCEERGHVHGNSVESTACSNSQAACEERSPVEPAPSTARTTDESALETPGYAHG